MRKDLGSVLALYPTPITVIGVMADGKPTWTMITHIGIPARGLMISILKSNYINRGIQQSKAAAVHVVDESWLEKADVVGCISGNNRDKSQLFKYDKGRLGTPVIKESKLTIECSVHAIYEDDRFNDYLLKVEHTYADETILNEAGKIDYTKFKPVLYEFPTDQYLRTGDIISKARFSENKPLRTLHLI